MQFPEMLLFFQVKKINGNDWEEDLESRNLETKNIQKQQF